MQQALSTYPSSHCGHTSTFIPQDSGIGKLFRDHGEAYITAYKPSLQKIKLIRSIRICRTPHFGGTAYECKGCGKRKYVYFSCGNSQCPKCQGIKRLQWQDKLANRMLKVPYQHMVFTMPHGLNSLAKHNPAELYNILMRSAWSSLMECAADPGNLGALPGVVMVLHTFGSDLKYHVHAHCLVTFGGISTDDKWCWPKRKKKIVPFRQMRRVFRSHFLSRLRKKYPQLRTREPLGDIATCLMNKQWCVHAERPTTDTKVIEEYLGRYICRIGLSKKKVHYDHVHQHITLTYNDYRKQKTGQAAPKAQKKLQPLLAIHHILQHVLPPYFQKCRYYGLHASSTYKKYQASIPTHLKRNQQTVRTLFQIIKAMLGVEKVQCEDCNNTTFDKIIISADHTWVSKNVTGYHLRSPPFSTHF